MLEYHMISRRFIAKTLLQILHFTDMAAIRPISRVFFIACPTSSFLSNFAFVIVNLVTAFNKFVS